MNREAELLFHELADLSPAQPENYSLGTGTYRLSYGLKVEQLTRRRAATFRSNSWMDAALRHFNVESEAASLPDDLQRSVEEAQRRQAKGNQSRRSD